jgi:hypothetical protein
MSKPQIVTIARFTLLEAARTRFAWHFLVMLGLIMAAAYFVQMLAVTESQRLHVGFSAAATRLAAVFMLSLHVLTSMVREFNDKGLELALSCDLPRSHYILGRLCGFALIAVLVAMVASLPHLLITPPGAALLWGLSLALELATVAAISLFCIVTFTQLMPAASFVLGFYLLSRTLTAIRMMSDAPLVGADTLSHQFISLFVDLLALVLPAFDRYTQSGWLVGDDASWLSLGAQAVQTAIYVVLLGAAAMFDFYRRNL